MRACFHTLRVLSNLMRVLANLIRVYFLPVMVLANIMRVYFLPVRVIFADLMKVCFHIHTVRVLVDMMRVLAIL